jgi:hypothetical protein
MTPLASTSKDIGFSEGCSVMRVTQAVKASEPQDECPWGSMVLTRPHDGDYQRRKREKRKSDS